MICKYCGVYNFDGMQYCGNCGYYLAIKSPRSHKPIMITAIVILVVAGCILCYLALPWILIGVGTALSPAPPEPIKKHGEFPFRLIYEVDGTQFTIEDTIICDYAGRGMDEGRGKYIKWDARLKSGNELTGFYFTREHQYGIELFDGFIEGQGNISILYDIGNPEYYLGYYTYESYKPGYTLISTTGNVISSGPLWHKYKIRIIEQAFSKPLEGNSITKEFEW